MEPVERKELGTGRVAFLARKDAIKEKIDSGRTSMSVYREYQKQIDISYSQFSRYVAKYINPKPVVVKETKLETPETDSGRTYGQPSFKQNRDRDPNDLT